MAHSYIEFQGKHFIVNDIMLIVFAEMIMDALRSDKRHRNDAGELLSAWTDTLNSAAAGAYDLELDRLASLPQQRQLLCAASGMVADALARKDEIPARELEQISKHRLSFSGGRQAADFLDICRQFESLLDGG